MSWASWFNQNGIEYALTNFGSEIDFLVSLSDEKIIEAIRKRDPVLFDVLETVLGIKDEFVTVKTVEEYGPKSYFAYLTNGGNLDQVLSDSRIVTQSKFAKQETKNTIEARLPGWVEEAKISKDRITRMNKGVIYLIRADIDNRPYKIGWTKNLKKRTELFAVKLPFEFEIVHSLDADNAREAEAKLHKEYAGKRLIGEWFDLSQFDVTCIKARLEYRNEKWLIDEKLLNAAVKQRLANMPSE